MTLTLTARHFAGGVAGGVTLHEEKGERGLIAYCVCGWTGKLRTKGGWNAFRAQALRDYDKHCLTCQVAQGLKPPPDWGTIPHIARAENEIIHSHRSWRAKCDCGWRGELHCCPDAQDEASAEAIRHMADNPTPAPVVPNIQRFQ